MSTRSKPAELRLLAAGVCLMSVAAVLVSAVFGVATLFEDLDYDGPEEAWYVAIVVLSVPTCVVGAITVLAAGRYTANRDVTGRRVALLALATWVLWFLWGIPASGAWFSAALVLYTALALPVVGLVLLVSWLARRERE